VGGSTGQQPLQAAGSRQQAAGSRRQAACSMQHAACGRQQAAGSRQQGARPGRAAGCAGALGYFLAVSRQERRNSPSPCFMMLALCTAVTFLRLFSTAYSNAYSAICSDLYSVMTCSGAAGERSLVRWGLGLGLGGA
jgi:hypothetical protein